MSSVNAGVIQGYTWSSPGSSDPNLVEPNIETAGVSYGYNWNVGNTGIFWQTDVTLRIFLLVLIFWGIFISVLMTFMPQKVLRYVSDSRLWSWYLSKMFDITREDLSGTAALMWLRIQGGIGLIATFLAMYVWLRHGQLV